MTLEETPPLPSGEASPNSSVPTPAAEPPPIPTDAAVSSVPETPPVEPPVVPASPPPASTPAPVPESSPAPPAESAGKPENSLRALLTRAREKIQFRKRAKLEKIVVKAKEKGSIGNDEVQKLLRVSHATATRYLAQLVREGRLKQTGHPRNAAYTPVP